MPEQNTNTEEQALEQRVHNFETQIESWFVETIHNSPVSRVSDIFNHVRAAVDALKQRLAALVKEL